MSKRIEMSPRPQSRSPADSWVESRSAVSAEPRQKPKRLTIDIDPTLHTRLKLHCVSRDIQIADFLRDLIAATLPPAE